MTRPAPISPAPARPAPTRRALLTTAATATAVAALPVRAQEAAEGMAGTATAPSGTVLAKYVPAESDYPFEVRHTEDEWRAMLDDEETYGVLRLANTEWPKSTDLWREAHDGEYHCRGCDLPVYEGRWFEPLDKGWVFFHHAMPHSVMFSVDGPVRQYGMDPEAELRTALTEVHCRRCGSHLGHHLLVAGQYLHCINGTALTLA